MEAVAPWIVLVAFFALTWSVTPKRVAATQFFDGRRDDGRPPGVWLVSIYLMRTRGGYRSLPHLLAGKYGVPAVKLSCS